MRRCVWLTVLLMAVSVPAFSQSVSFEKLTVAGTAVSLAAGTVNPSGKPAPDLCRGVAEDASLRYREDGTAPTTTTGNLAPQNSILELYGQDTIRQFTAIRVTSTSAVISLSCYEKQANGRRGVVVTIPASATAVGTTGVYSTSVTTGAPGAIALNLGGNSAAATTSSVLVKTVGSIADATATNVLTVTVPNAAHSASLRVTLVGSLGAGGTIGANEGSGTVSYDLAITRTSGVAAAIAISAAYGSAMTATADAATMTVTAAASAITGAVGAINTFTVQVTITKSGGASANHTCLVKAEVLNANASGVTIL